MPDAPNDFAAAAARFADELADKFALDVGGQPEDPLKAPVGELLRDLGQLTDRDVNYRTEVRVEDIGRPDLGVTVGGLLAGYVELKAPGFGARPEHFPAGSPNADQWKRFRALPNLIYTDGEEWSLYRKGKRRATIRLGAELTANGANGLDDSAADALQRVLLDFLGWEPITPRNPRELAEFIAPWARMLRDEVERAAAGADSPLRSLAAQWREILFPEAADAQFADAYAQTLTYALLLAHFEDADSLQPELAALSLRRQHALLADALKLLDSEAARDELRTPIELIERAIAAVDIEAIRRADAQDPWLYFYEQFLAAYDPKLRKNRGVYFTPIEVVRCQVRLAAELLRARFGKEGGFADDGVTILDPAVGSGAYPLAVIQHAEDSAREVGTGYVEERLHSLARRLYAFELLVGPYAVAHLRIAQRLRDAGVEDYSPRVYLTDTLASPHQTGDAPPLLQMMLPSIPREWQHAQQVKGETPILVCIGNPPYDRQQIDPDDETQKRKGGWVRYGDDEDDTETKPILDDFLKPARQAGQGVHIKNLYNDYVYFWRWALWKVFESSKSDGIVSFITASSYLYGPGFVGMRKVMREVFDELWIIDLEGDNLGARKTENVFNIQTPVAIAIGVRSGGQQKTNPARVWIARATGNEAEKLAFLDQIESFADVEWRECASGWTDPFYATSEDAYAHWPRLIDVFPWQHTGAEIKRIWPIGESAELLATRWRELLKLSRTDRRTAFRETRDRKVNGEYKALVSGERAASLASLPPDADMPPALRYAHRAFDRRWVIADSRVGDYMRPPLWHSYSTEQTFITSLLNDVLGSGAAAVACANVPDRHHFSGRGGKDVIPLWRDAEATEPNVASGLLAVLSSAFGTPVSAPDLFAYAYAALAQPAYVERFWNQLEQPPPRLPITRDGELFRRAAEHGAQLLQLHTYGERFGRPGEAGGVPRGEARFTVKVPRDDYPDGHRYDESTRTLHVGKGEFAPVAPEVWNYSVSGLQVVKSWLDYRKREPGGRQSSPLDKIRPEHWEFGGELLALLWVLERTIALQPAGERLLDEVLASELFTASELPTPQPHERKPPNPPSGTAPLGGGSEA